MTTEITVALIGSVGAILTFLTVFLNARHRRRIGLERLKELHALANDGKNLSYKAERRLQKLVDSELDLLRPHRAREAVFNWILILLSLVMLLGLDPVLRHGLLFSYRNSCGRTDVYLFDLHIPVVFRLAYIAATVACWGFAAIVLHDYQFRRRHGL